MPQKLPIFKLLQAFKLQQYTKTFVDLGYGEDVYKLTMMSQRKKQELFGQIDFLPGHKQRLIDLFRRVDNVSLSDLSKFTDRLYTYVDVPAAKCCTHSGKRHACQLAPVLVALLRLHDSAAGLDVEYLRQQTDWRSVARECHYFKFNGCCKWQRAGRSPANKLPLNLAGQCPADIVRNSAADPVPQARSKCEKSLHWQALQPTKQPDPSIQPT